VAPGDLAPLDALLTACDGSARVTRLSRATRENAIPGIPPAIACMPCDGQQEQSLPAPGRIARSDNTSPAVSSAKVETCTFARNLNRGVAGGDDMQRSRQRRMRNT